MNTILMQTTGSLGGWAWMITLASFLYLTYKSAIANEEPFVKMLSGINAIKIAVLFFTFASLPASILALFGPMESLVTLFMGLVTSVLAGALFAIATNMFVKIAKGEMALPGI